MKKCLVIFCLLLLLIFSFYKTTNIIPVYATTTSQEELESELEDTIELQLESLELGEVENIYGQFVGAEEKTFQEKLSEILNGENTLTFDAIFSVFIDNIIEILRSNYKILLLILIIGFLSALIENLAFSKGNSTFSSSVSFVFVVFVATIISVSVVQVIKEASTTLLNISSVVEVISPILFAIMISLGAVSSSAIYQPAVSVLTSVITTIFATILFEIITFMFVITILGSLLNQFQLGKINEFCSSLLKWIISIVFTIFVGYLSIKGITAGSYDGLSIRTAKYAIRSYIPVVGGYLSEGFEVFRGGSVLIKNSIGIIGIIVLISVVLTPLLKLVVLNLTFKLAGALTDMVGAGKISRLLTGVTKIFNFVFAVIFSVFMMCFILFLLIIMTANMV